MSIQARLITGLIFCLISAFGTWHVQNWRWQEKLDGVIQKQVEFDHAQCETDKQITEDAQNDLQKRLNAVSRKLAVYRLQPKARCIMPVTKQAGAPSAGAGYAGADGISTNWLRSYAAECEQYRQERLTLEAFEAKVWASHK